jgi:Ran GTPase-activating protein (RanGAP) involved in mRNA processing and transport
MPFLIESGYSLYRVVGPDGEEGDAVEYGTPAFLEIGHHLFMTYIDDPNEIGEHEGQLYELTAIVSGTEDVEFEGDEPDEEDEDEDEDEDGEETGAAAEDGDLPASGG